MPVTADSNVAACYRAWAQVGEVFLWPLIFGQRTRSIFSFGAGASVLSEFNNILVNTSSLVSTIRPLRVAAHGERHDAWGALL